MKNALKTHNKIKYNIINDFKSIIKVNIIWFFF